MRDVIINGNLYHFIDSKMYNGQRYELYEHDIDGDEAPCAILNSDGLFIGYTWDDLITFLNDHYAC